MRCNNCGFDNPSGNSRCQKCNMSLTGSMVQNNNPVNNNAPLTGTVRGQQPNTNEYLDSPPPPEKKEVYNERGNDDNLECPHCGYPLMDSGALKCPNCKKEIEDSRKQNIDKKYDNNNQVQQNYQKRQNQQNQQNQQNKQKISGTVDPWRHIKHSKCSLIPVHRLDEEPFDIINFSGEEIILNRENLENNNMTITGNTQAVIQKIHDKWYITDKSSNQTTYVQVSEPQEIKSGDSILMGNRIFKFDC